MKVIRNRPEDMVVEMIDGYVNSNPGLLERVERTKSILVKNVQDRVVILAGGGAGCEPLYMGCAGRGMADAIATGNIFAAPPATELLRTMKHMYHDKGVLMITGNYIGDVLNYELAVELCGYEGIEVQAVFVKDDILHMPKDKADRRRGIGGILPVIKIAAGAAAEGLDLEAVKNVAEHAIESTGTVSVTFWPGYRPETGELMYEMDPALIEFGMGFNGEPGIKKAEMLSANGLAKMILEYLIPDMELKENDEIAMLISGKGATSPMELYILANSLRCHLSENHISIFSTEIGNLFTAPGMGGVSVTLIRLNEELKCYYNKDSYTPMYAYDAATQGVTER